MANSVTTAAWVAGLRPGLARHWVTGTAGACTGLFKPVRVGEPIEIGPPPIGHDDGASLWWRHERLHRAVLHNPTALLPLYAAERDSPEAQAVTADIDPVAAFAEGERLLEAWKERVLAESGPDSRPLSARRYWGRREREAAGLTTGRIEGSDCQRRRLANTMAGAPTPR